VYSDPGILKLEKNQYNRYVLAIENNNAYLIGQGFTKNGQFPFISEFNLKQHKQNVYTLRHTLIKEDVIEIEDFKELFWYKFNLERISELLLEKHFPKKNKLTPITTFKIRLKASKREQK
jgi:hypothetical protein